MTAQTETQIREGYVKQAALAQLFRWWQFYEHPESSLANQLDILAEDVHIDSSGNAVNNRAEYQAYAESLPQMRNAHWLDAPTLTMDVVADGIVASLDAKYLNIGALPDGALMNATVHYDIELTSVDNSVLPEFTKIIIAAGAGDGSTEFVDAYATNRVASLVHYYLALLGQPDFALEPFSELFADEFAFEFSGASITTIGGFDEWVQGYRSLLDAAMLSIESFDVVDQGDGAMTATIDFEWDGLMADGSRMEMGTRHVWHVVDNPAERFARARSIEVTKTREMAPKTS